MMGGSLRDGRRHPGEGQAGYPAGLEPLNPQVCTIRFAIKLRIF